MARWYGALLLATIGFYSPPQCILAQTTTVLPADLSARQGTALVSELSRLRDLSQPAVRQLSVLTASKASELLQQPQLLSPQLAYDIGIGVRRHATAEQTAPLIEELRAAAGPENSFAPLQSAYQALAAVGLVDRELAAITSGWLADKDVSGLGLEELAWLAPRLAAPAVNPLSFEVQWQGTLTPPRSGNYVFSTTPIRSGYLKSDHTFAKQELEVRIGGQLILACTTDAWNWRGEPVALTADETVNIDVRFSYRAIDEVAPVRPGAAFLYWESDGLPRQLVPAERLASGAEGGLAAGYRSLDGPQTSLRQDAEIARLFVAGSSGPGADSQLRDSVVASLYQKALSPDTLTAVLADTALAVQHPLLAEPSLASGLLSAQQRAAWLDVLRQSPQLVNGLDFAGMADLYTHLRYDDPDAALELFGHWLGANRRARSSFTNWYARDVRRVYWEMADRLNWEYPEHGVRWAGFVVQPDGGCSLPAAYTMAFLSALQGRMDEWKAEIDSHLDGGSLVSDQRAEWLIARAVTREVQYTATDRYEEPSIFPAWAEESLLEATQAAATYEMRELAYHELIVRYATQRVYDQAEETIETAASRLGSAQGEAVAGWVEAVSRLETAHQLDAELQDLVRQQVYQAKIEEQLELARQAGRPEAVQIYETLKAQAE